MAKTRIGYPCTPCKLLERAEMKAYKVKMSCGGGMGGSAWNEYIKTDIMATDNIDQIVQIETIFGEKKKINLRYVVDSEQVRVVYDFWDVTQHANYHKKVCLVSQMKRWIEVGMATEIQYVDDYVWEEEERHSKVIKKDTITH